MAIRKTIIILVLSLLGYLYAEDWTPIFADLDMTIAKQEEYQLIAEKASFLSGSDRYTLFYLRNVDKENGLLRVKDGFNSFSVIAIVYKTQCNYIKLPNETQIDFTIINDDEYPLIMIKYINAQGDVSSDIIAYTGKKFIEKSYAEDYHRDDGLELLRFQKMTYEMDGIKYIYDYTYNLVGVDNEYYSIRKIANQERFSYYISDNNVRLRTNPNQKSSVIKLLEKDEHLRIILVDPRKTTVNGSFGQWVLVQTEKCDLGWVWSEYIGDFYWDKK